VAGRCVRGGVAGLSGRVVEEGCVTELWAGGAGLWSRGAGLRVSVSGRQRRGAVKQAGLLSRAYGAVEQGCVPGRCGRAV